MIFLYSTALELPVSPLEEVTVMEVKDALSLMFVFGMFILALLGYIKKK